MSAATEAGLWDRFAAKAEILGVSLARAASEADAVALIRTEAGSFGRTASLAERFPRLAAATPADGADSPHTEMVARGLFAVAETGSVLLAEPAADRGACLLAERLWLVVAAEDIVPTLDEALARVGALIRDGRRYLILMSGPSRSADIERTVTVGVHGPRALSIVVVGREDPA